MPTAAGDSRSAVARVPPPPASILAAFSPLPFMVFDADGSAIIELSDVGSETVEFYISPRDLSTLRELLRRQLRAIVSNHELPQVDRSWAIHRAMLRDGHRLLAGQ